MKNLKNLHDYAGSLAQYLLLILVAFLAANDRTSFAQPAVDLLEKEQAAFQRAAEIATPYVVQIETFGGLEKIGKQAVAEGPTTGTILTHDGWIVSTLHNFRQQPASILVNLPTGERKPARIIARDFSRELALLKVEVESKLPHIPDDIEIDANSNDLVGTWVLALGKTYDKTQASRSVGIVSAIGRAYDRAIQTDAKISPINYGGPLVNLLGQPIGILSPISPGTFFDGDSSNIYDSGIGFAIPIGDILERLPTLQAGDDIHPGKLGIVSSDQNELAGPVQIVGSIPGSPAAKAGIKSGDVLLEASNRKINILADLRHAIGRTDAGDTLTISVLRSGKRIDGIECELAKEIPTYNRRYLGMQIRRMNEEEESDDDAKFVIVGIEKDSPADVAGIKRDQILLKFRGEQIESLSALRAKIAVLELDQDVELELRAGDETKQLTIRPSKWPNEIPEALPAPIAATDDAAQCKVVDIALGDFTNKAFALVPPTPSDGRELGLLMLFPEPGETDRKKAQQLWEEFACRQGWIIAIADSANPARWSMQETEIAQRILGRMQKNHELDEAKVVTAGIGVGGRLAIIAAQMLQPRVKGTIAIGSKINMRGVRQKNMPLQSIDFLLVGETTELAGPAQMLQDAGFSAITLDAPNLDNAKWETQPLEEIQLWLEGLGRF